MRLRARSVLLIVTLPLACSVEVVKPNETQRTNRFLSEIKPDFWPALDYDDPLKLHELSNFTATFEDIVAELESNLAAGKYTNRYDREAIGRVFFYFGHMMHSNVLVTLEGRISINDLIKKTRYSTLPVGAEGFEQDELLKRIDRSIAILTRASEMRPDDRRPKVAELSAKTTRDRVLTGQTTPESVQALLDYATDPSKSAVDQRATMVFPNFDIMVAMLTLRNVRDPNLMFVLKDDNNRFRQNAHMLNLSSFIQRRVNPDIGPGVAAPTPDQVAKLHFVAMTAPLLRSDYFARYAHDLWRVGKFEEAKTQLYTAQTALVLIREILYPLLNQYPLGDVVAPREAFLGALETGINRRTDKLWVEELGETKELKIEDVFLKKSFIAPYLCSNCHAAH